MIAREPTRALAYIATQQKEVVYKRPVPAVHRHQLRRARAVGPISSLMNVTNAPGSCSLWPGHAAVNLGPHNPMVVCLYYLYSA